MHVRASVEGGRGRRGRRGAGEGGLGASEGYECDVFATRHARRAGGDDVLRGGG